MYHLKYPDQRTIQIQSLSKVLRNTPQILPRDDHEKLQQHLEACECVRRPSSKLLSYVLANKLMNTRPVDDVHHSDLVVGGAVVTYTVNGNEPQTGEVIHRARVGLSDSAIPVSSLLGATLIGMHVGERAPLLFEDGTIGRLTVTAVSNSN